MSRRTVSSDRAPAAIGPYAQGVVSDGLLFTSMQIALDPRSGEMVGTTSAEQARQCLQNVRAVVQAAGGSLADVIKTTVTMTDITEFGAVNDVYAEFFVGDLPARAVLEASALPKGALVAVEAVARISRE
jgi:2-iminobutanoate/2-iminopropanoate deaminase